MYFKKKKKISSQSWWHQGGWGGCGCVKHGGVWWHEHLRIFLSDQFSWIKNSGFTDDRKCLSFLKCSFCHSCIGLFKTPCRTLLRGSNHFTPIITSSYLLVGSEVNYILYLVDLSRKFPIWHCCLSKMKWQAEKKKIDYLGELLFLFNSSMHVCVFLIIYTPIGGTF